MVARISENNIVSHQMDDSSNYSAIINMCCPVHLLEMSPGGVARCKEKAVSWGAGREIHVDQRQRKAGCGPEAGDKWYSLTHATISEPGSPPWHPCV